MPNADVILGLLLAVVVLTTIARQLGVAYPVLLVLGGLALNLVPGVPAIALPPNLVLVLFLPPLLYWESSNLSYRDLRFSIRPILSLAIGLVLATIAAVAVVAHTVLPGFTWALAFVLGTIVGPTDEVAAAAIAERLPLPARLLALIEDESLLHDASSLVAYNVAVAAVVTGAVSLLGTGVQVLVAALGGIAIGLRVGWVIGQVRRRAATQAGVERLNSSARDGSSRELIDGLRKQLQDRSRRFVERASPSQSRARRTQHARDRRLLREILDAERSALIDLRD